MAFQAESLIDYQYNFPPIRNRKSEIRNSTNPG